MLLLSNGLYVDGLFNIYFSYTTTNSIISDDFIFNETKFVTKSYYFATIKKIVTKNIFYDDYKVSSSIGKFISGKYLFHQLYLLQKADLSVMVTLLVTRMYFVNYNPIN